MGRVQSSWKRIFILKVDLLNWNSGEVHTDAFRMACGSFRDAYDNHSNVLDGVYDGLLLEVLGVAVVAKDEDGGMARLA